MRVLKYILDFYVNSSIHVALAVTALVWVTLLKFHFGADLHFLGFVFFSTITAYNFIKYFGLAKFHHRSLANWLKVIQIFSLLCFVVFAYLMSFMPVKVLIATGIIGVITYLYAAPILPKSLVMDAQRNLRGISGLKNYVIALVWVGSTVVLPTIYSNADWTLDMTLEALQRYAYVLAVMVPFDIFDLKFDSVRLATWPQRIGIVRTKGVGVLLCIVFWSLEMAKSQIGYRQVQITAVIAIIVGVSILFSSEKRNRYYSAIFVEGIPLIWALIITANY